MIGSAMFRRDEMIERKIRYDSTLVDHHCFLLKATDDEVVLFHEITDSFTMYTPKSELTISKGCYTIAHYWRNRPYNLYIWRNKQGIYLGAYFNLVKNTSFLVKMVTFEDLILDILVLPDGNRFILDEDELPVPLDVFENGSVQQALGELLDSIDDLLAQIILPSEHVYKHGSLLPLLSEE
ncbi:DUF402 domain-containing protein [Peribacillus sp. SI8-4]|uniref:DUF402 domain-containing protein n=1 Tax=Peribacillus sp. SI8-4 TaxID=3048009 RepID=UPI00255301F9|nr:DUF402 domain-containing protein [Peribacillus sp. SI8-4]